jgi:hypothetical protein
VSDLDHFYRALTSVHPRSAQVLMARFFWVGDHLGRSPLEFAAHYGISAEAADVLLFRASREFFEALSGRPGPGLLPDATEAQLAHRFGQAVEGAVPPPEFNDLILCLRGLNAHARELRARLDAAEQAELTSPEYARETWIRRAAIVVVLALSAWFYWKVEITQWWQQVRPSAVSDADAGR